MKRMIAALFLAGMQIAPASAATETIHIYGYVPVICRAELTSASIIPITQGGETQLGVISEFCNAGSGYQIVADYSSGEADPGSLVVDGRTIPLNGSGESTLVTMDGPRILSQSLAYIPGSTPITAIHIQILASSI